MQSSRHYTCHRTTANDLHASCLSMLITHTFPTTIGCRLFPPSFPMILERYARHSCCLRWRCLHPHLPLPVFRRYSLSVMVLDLSSRCTSQAWLAAKTQMSMVSRLAFDPDHLLNGPHKLQGTHLYSL